MNSTALAFAGGIICGIFAGAFLLAIFIFAVMHMDDEDENIENNDNNDNNKQNF